jgi:DNA-binding HxlR family transcriptional regulator
MERERECWVEIAMQLLGGRWRLALISYLSGGPQRFNALKRGLPGISQRMLTIDLRALEKAGMVKRTVFPTVPVTVQYELTDDGQHLLPAVKAMDELGRWLGSRNQASMGTGLRESIDDHDTDHDESNTNNSRQVHLLAHEEMAHQ